MNKNIDFKKIKKLAEQKIKNNPTSIQGCDKKELLQIINELQFHEAENEIIKDLLIKNHTLVNNDFLSEKCNALYKENEILKNEIAFLSKDVNKQNDISEITELLTKSGQIGIIDWDIKNNTISLNSSLLKTLGYDSSNNQMDIILWKSLFFQEDYLMLKEEINLAVNNRRSSFKIQHRLRHKDKSIYWAMHSGIIILGTDKKPQRIISSIIDITECKVTELNLEESEIRYRTLFESSNEGMLVIDPNDMRIVFSNQKIETLIGYSTEELFDKKFCDLHTIDKCIEDKCIKNKCMFIKDMKNTIKPDVQIIHKDESIIYVDINCIETLIDTNVFIICFLRDVTDRKLAYETLFKTESQLEQILNNSSAIIYLKDLDGKYLFTNNTFKSAFKLSDIDIIGKTDLDLFNPEYATKFRLNDILAIEKGSAIQVEEIIYQTNGLRTYLSDKFPLYKDNKIYAICGISTDITQKKQLEKRNEYLGNITEQVTDSILTTNLEFMITYANQSFLNLFGYKEEEIIGKSPNMFNAEENFESIQNNIYQTISAGKTWSGILKNKKKDNTKFFCDFTVFPMIDDNGDIYGFASSQRDVTERINLNLALTESEEKYRSLIELSPEAIVILQDGIYKFVNQEFLNMFQYSKQDIEKGLSFFELVLEEDKQIVADIYEKRLQGTEINKTFIFNLIKKNKEIITCQTSAAKIQYNNRPADLVIITDISDKIKAQKRIKLYEDAVNSSIVPIGFGNFDGKITFANKAFLDLFGYDDVNKVINQPIRKFSANPKTLMKNLSNLSSVGGWTAKGQIIKADKSIVPVLYTINPILDDNGSMISIMASFIDITIEENYKKQLQISEKKYREYIDNAPEGVAIMNQMGEHIDANNAALELFGYDLDEFLKMSAIDLIHPDYKDFAYKKFEELVEKSRLEAEMKCLHKSGKTFWISLSAVKTFDGNYIGFLTDITKRVEIENILQETNEQLDATLKAVPNLMIEVDEDVVIKNIWTSNINNLYLPPDQLIGKKPAQFFPEKQAKVATDFVINFHNNNTQKNNMISLPINDQLKWYKMSITYKSTDENSKKRYLLLVTDITELIEAQNKEKELQKTLVESDRLISVGRLAAGLAHEINNPMTVLFGILEETKINIDELSQESVDQMHKVSKRIIEIILNLLTFSKQNIYEKTIQNINPAITDTLILLTSHVNKLAIALEFEEGKNLPDALINKGKIQQVIMNVIFNSIDALKKGGEIKIVTALEDNDYVTISIADNGAGIPTEDFDKIFIPFFSTKEVGKGIGLGLSICHGIIEEHNGRIEIQSKMGHGTTVKIYLPISK